MKCRDICFTLSFHLTLYVLNKLLYSVFTSVSCTLYFNILSSCMFPFQKTVHSYREAFEQMESAPFSPTRSSGCICRIFPILYIYYRLILTYISRFSTFVVHLYACFLVASEYLKLTMKVFLFK